MASSADYRRGVSQAWIVAGAIVGLPIEELLRAGPMPAEQELLELLDYAGRRLRRMIAARAAELEAER